MQIAQTSRNKMKPENGTGPERGRSRVTGMVMKTCCSIAALVAVMVGTPFSSMADIPLVYAIENTGTNYPAPPLPTLANLPFIQPLPDPFCWASDPFNMGGTRSTNLADWEHRRNEIAAQIQNYEIGTKPAVDIPTQVTASYSGGTTPGTSGTLIVHVTANGHTLNLTNAISIPAAAIAPYPICIGMDSPYGSLNFSDFTSRGIAGLTYRESQVTTYGSPSTSDPYYVLYGPALNPTSTGQYSAWAWGVSRVIDGLSLVTNTLPIDLKHICVTGCSYAGKLALFSGALDERIALTVAQESGGGGATSWRYSHTEPFNSVELIDNTDYNWFENSMSQFSGNSVSYLPEDHHELMAMVAPRALFVTANPGWTWLSNPSCYVCSRACQQIYDTLGISERFGYNIVGGHTHCATTTAVNSEVAAFLDKFMLGNTNVNTTIRDYDSSYNTINYASWMAWWGSTTPVFPSIQLSLPAAATEGNGTLVGQGNVSVGPTPTSDLVVNLTSSDTSEVTVPASVIIPAGQSNVLFDLTIIDDSLLDGDQTAAITVVAPGYGTNQTTITVHDNETATLSVTLPASASESAGTLVNAGSVGIGTAAGKNVTVSLSSSDPSRLIVPPATVIPAGQTSAVFNLTFVNNNVVEGPQTVSVTAHVPNWTDGSTPMTILDDDLPDHFGWSVIPSPQIVGQPFNATITAYDNNNSQVNYTLSASFSAWALGPTPATNTFLNSPSAQESWDLGGEYTMGYSFTPNTNLVVTAVRAGFGDKVSLWTDTGVLLATQNVTSVPGTWVETPLTTPVVLLAGVTYRVGVHVNNGTLYWVDNVQATFPNGTINSPYFIEGDTFPDGSDSVEYLVDLRYGTDVGPVPVSPVVSGNFTGGAWSGNFTVLRPATHMVLQASINGHSGQSLPFDVLNAPSMTIMPVAGSMVISWPMATPGFTLEETHDLAAGSWTAVTNAPAEVNNNYILTNTPTAATMFYRLHKP